jgi:hypothetical protein
MMQPNLINPNPKIYDISYDRKKTSSLPYVPDITDRIDAAEVYGARPRSKSQIVIFVIFGSGTSLKMT